MALLVNAGLTGAKRASLYRLPLYVLDSGVQSGICVSVRVTLFLCPLVADEGHSRFPVGVAGFFLNPRVTRAFQETGRAGPASGISKLTALPSWQVPSCCVIFPEL